MTTPLRSSWALVLALSTGIAAAQQPMPAYYSPANSITVGADGKFEAEPDRAVVNFTVAAQAETSDAAYARASKAAEAVRQVLRANGIDPKSAEISQYSLQPMIDYKSAKRKIIAYRATSTVSIRLKDFAKVGPLTQGFSNISDTENQSVHYILLDTEAAKQKAIEDAMSKAKASAATVAKAGNRVLGDLSHASVDVNESGPVYPMMATRNMAMAKDSMEQAPTEEFTPTKITINVHVNAVFQLK